MGKLKKIGNTLLSFAGHLLAGGIIFYFWQPIASWYWHHRPILGIDFYNTVSYVSYLLENFTLRTNGWKYIWYTGNSFEHDYPTLYFYLILPLAKIFGVIQGVQLFMLLALFLFAFFSYLAFWELSKSKILSGIFCVGVLFSIGVYGALVWGGSLPYFVSQTFFAATLYFVIKYLHSGRKKFLSGAALLTALSIFGHPQVAITFIFPTVAILLLFWAREGFSFFDRRKFFDFLLFLGMVFLVTYPRIIYENAGPDPRSHLNFIFLFVEGLFHRFSSGINFFLSSFGPDVLAAQASSSQIEAGGRLAIQEWQKSQIKHFIDWTNPLFFLLLGAISLVYCLSAFLRTRKREMLNVLPLVLVVGYALFYVVIYGFGIDFYHGGWYRVFWAAPVALGLLIAWLWGDLQRFWQLRVPPESRISKTVSFFSLILVFLISGFVFWQYNPSLILKLDKKWGELSHASSAFPNVVNLAISKQEREELKKHLVPSWLNPSSYDFRLLESDAQVNIWWNSFFDLPLARGYIDPPSGEGWFFWLNEAIFAHGGELSQLVNNWHYPEPVALNNALFLLDWYGIKYLEADHASDVNPQITKALLTPQFLKQEGEVFFAKEEKLINLAVSEKDAEKPIEAVNYPHLLFIGPKGLYQRMVDMFFTENSPPFIPLWKGEEADLLTKLDLRQYEAIFLYEYGYREAANDYSRYLQIWGVLTDYIKGGGRLFIDPAGKGIDASTRDARSFYTTKRVFDPSKPPGSQYYDVGIEPTLPEPFPLFRTVSQERKLGVISGKKHPLVEGVKLDQLGEKQGLRKISLSSEGLKEGGKVVVEYQDHPILVERDFGQGKVIWSGLGLLDLLEDKSEAGEKLLRNILAFWASPARPKPTFIAQSQNFGRGVFVSGKNSRGIVINKLGNQWDFEASLKIKKDNQSLEIFSLREGIESLVYILLPETLWKGEFEMNILNNNTQKLHYYELNDQLVSPILQATNAPTIGVVGKQTDYEVVIRSLAANNLNSWKVIPLWVTWFLDDLSPSELDNFDALVLYGYDYRNQQKVWRILEEYVKKGGKIFIETGNEVKQTDSEDLPSRFPKDLPSIFPLQRTKQGQLGKEWNLSSPEFFSEERISFEQFGPPVLDGNPWKFSYPSGENLRSGAEVLLENQGTPLVVGWDYGQGKVIWSGMNLFYHLVYYNNLEEGKFLQSLLSQLVDLRGQDLPKFSAQRVSAKMGVVESQEAKGVLFKERSHPGWKARLDNQKVGDNLKIYNAGATFPGFMYARIPPQARSSSFKITFSFQGTAGSYFYTLLSLLAFGVIFDYTFFAGRFLARRSIKICLKAKRFLGGWWGKEEEY